jgi:hypothetical protein
LAITLNFITNEKSFIQRSLGVMADSDPLLPKSRDSKIVGKCQRGEVFEHTKADLLNVIKKLAIFLKRFKLFCTN